MSSRRGSGCRRPLLTSRILPSELDLFEKRAEIGVAQEAVMDGFLAAYSERLRERVANFDAVLQGLPQRRSIGRQGQD